MMTSMRRCLFFLILPVLLCQCGAPQPPQCHRIPAASRAPAATLLAAAHADWKILANSSRSHEWPAAQARYNAAVAHLFDQLRCGPDGWDSRAAAIGTRIAPASREQVNLASLNALFPASLVKPNAHRKPNTTPGVGVPLVGWKKTSPVGMPRPKFLLPNGLPYTVTATLTFEDKSAPTWHFAKRWLQDEISLGSTTQPLAADWGAANAFFWHMCDLDDLKIQNVILPDRFMEETGIYFVTPYDPEKIPVVFVHGLVSSPDAFKNMIDELAPEPWFRKNYQIWLYNYPTGNPWLFSSMKFRETIRDATAFARTQGHDRNLNRMVLVSHSMGGLITRSSVTPPQTAIYDANFKKPFDQLKGSAKIRKFISDTMLYQPLTEPKRVVFLAVPHRGSPMATAQISTWISRLIRLPKTLTIDLLDSTLMTMSDVIQGENPTNHFPTSINSLSPRAKSNIGLNRLPLPRQITFHSIIGDRGKNNTPDSSDGVVPYWSSHITPVASETIVPSNHSVPDNPQAAQELKLILKQHLDLKH